MPEPRHVIMVASENASLRGGKVGGVGDVVHDLPNALAALGWKCTVIIPSYGFLHHQNPASLMGRIHFPFRNHWHEAEFWEVSLQKSYELVRNIVVHHPWIIGEPIYFNDPSDQPFARDASKYALFCSAVGQFLRLPGTEGVLHLHDWHAATLLLLRDLHPEFSHLNNFKTIFTVHNLGIQGTRPMRNHDSSLEAWFPELFHYTDWVYHWKDPRYDSWFYTPMLAGIRFSYKVNTVSETYADEILHSSNHANGYFGGEGLEPLLQQAKMEGRLSGILNGFSYSPVSVSPTPIPELLNLIMNEVQNHQVQIGGLTLDDSIRKLQWLREKNINLLMTSVTRVVEQKVRLLCEKDEYGQVSLDSIAATLNDSNGLYILLGTGTPDYEWYLSEASRYHERFVFVRGYSEIIAKALYASGTMFLMPSLYEPCGISQMHAMSNGQPCVVHGVGGLKDTVWHDVNGFVFEGWTMKEKVHNFGGTVRHAVEVAMLQEEKWNAIKEAAR
ncbi:MAG: glycogen synthase, partial [Bacteroidetes bacterium]